jgi:tripartite-type tricarboxylate transporter receptor subunit TctC
MAAAASLILTASFVLTVMLTADARAQSYPVKAVRIIVPVAPGGGTDPQARLLGRKFQESMGQTAPAAWSGRNS